MESEAEMLIQSLTNRTKTRTVESTTATISGVNFEITLQVVTSSLSSHSYTRKHFKEVDSTTRTNYLTIAFPKGDAEDLHIVFGEEFPEKGIKLWLKRNQLEKLLGDLVETVRRLQESRDKNEGDEDDSFD